MPDSSLVQLDQQKKVFDQEEIYQECQLFRTIDYQDCLDKIHPSLTDINSAGPLEQNYTCSPFQNSMRRVLQEQAIQEIMMKFERDMKTSMTP